MLDLIFETNNLLLVTVGFFLSISAIMVIFSSNPVHAVFFLILVVLCLSSIFIGLGIEFLGVVLIVVYVGAIAVLFLFVVMMLNVRVDQNNVSLFRYLPIIGILIFFLLMEISLFYNSFFFFNLIDPIFDNFIISLYGPEIFYDFQFDALSYYSNIFGPFSVGVLGFKDMQDYYASTLPYLVGDFNHVYFYSQYIPYDLYMSGFLDKPFSIQEPTNIESFGFLVYNSFSLPFILVSIILLIAMIGPIVLTLDHKKSIKRQDIQSQIERDFNRTISIRTSKDKKMQGDHRRVFYDTLSEKFWFYRDSSVKKFKVRNFY